jgi:hypothetical protein
VELITPHRTNCHETRKGGQGLVWAVAPLHHQGTVVKMETKEGREDILQLGVTINSARLANTSL